MNKRINRLRLKIFAAGLALTVTGYLFIFGESGLLVRHDIEQKIASLKLQTEDLQKENLFLNKKYNETVRERRSAEGGETAATDHSQTTILKFNSNEPETETKAEPADGGISEARIVFVTTMFFLTLLAAVMAGSIVERKKGDFDAGHKIFDTPAG